MHLLEGMIVAPLGRAEATLSAGWQRDFARRGITLSLEDTLIAAGAIFQGLPLATGNLKDFPMPELRLEEWTVERPS